MPLPKGVKKSEVRYRWKTYPSGKKVRLAFANGKVVETKSYAEVVGKARKKHNGNDP